MKDLHDSRLSMVYKPSGTKFWKLKHMSIFWKTTTREVVNGCGNPEQINHLCSSIISIACPLAQEGEKTWL